MTFNSRVLVMAQRDLYNDSEVLAAMGVFTQHRTSSIDQLKYYDLPPGVQRPRYVDIADPTLVPHGLLKCQVYNARTRLPLVYNKDTEQPSDESNENALNSDEDGISGDCDPKQAPARWRGRGVSKAEYAESGQNYSFRPPIEKKGQDKEEEDENGRPGKDKGNGSGDDGDGDEEENPDSMANIVQRVDPREYYGYLFDSDKKPTKILDAMLRGIARYIIDNLEPLEDKTLTPAKLSTYYRKMGGNYDWLFKEIPLHSIAWIYAIIGCQHTLQPGSDNFTLPNILALTEVGFVRWQSTEILLAPNEHVPFIQTTIDNHNIKHPDTGESFPAGLPEESFPAVADREIEDWQRKCAEASKVGLMVDLKQSRMRDS